MRRMLLLAAAGVVSGALIPQPAAGGFDCNVAPTVDLGAAYVDVRHIADDEALWGIWVWAESGVSPGLQRGGTQVAFAAAGQHGLGAELGFYDYECPQSAASDYLIF